MPSHPKFGSKPREPVAEAVFCPEDALERIASLSWLFKIVTSRPKAARPQAVALPAGPPPTMKVSARIIAAAQWQSGTGTSATAPRRARCQLRLFARAIPCGSASALRKCGHHELLSDAAASASADVVIRIGRKRNMLASNHTFVKPYTFASNSKAEPTAARADGDFELATARGSF
jgi:hypothetical protein